MKWHLLFLITGLYPITIPFDSRAACESAIEVITDKYKGRARPEYMICLPSMLKDDMENPK